MSDRKKWREKWSREVSRAGQARHDDDELLLLLLLTTTLI